jgi:hypothetical protein
MFVLDDLTRMLLYKAYWWAFRSCKIKGIMEEKETATKIHLRETLPRL